ncbi:hypothetical protein CO614_00020 [Lysobacteraceae bacterium NML120232]|nr:hypothetical protein CO614_00020 [Xanthomonadaceae bacterium NML120232]
MPFRPRFSLCAALGAWYFSSSVAQINDGVTGGVAEDVHLLQWFVQGIAVIRMAGKASGGHDQAFAGGDGKAGRLVLAGSGGIGR